MYTTLTKGQRPSFKQFLQQPFFLQYVTRFFFERREDHIDISPKFLDDALNCFHLFRCFHEAGDVRTCESILKILDSNEIDLWGKNLTVYDVQCLTLFLACTPLRMWETVNLYGCYIQDRGLHVFHRGLIDSKCNINYLVLSDNNLTQSSSSYIRDLTIHRGLKCLWIDGNRTIGENHTLFSILSHPSSKLTLLSIMHTGLSSRAAISLFRELAKGNKLHILYVHIYNPTDKTLDVIATTMKENTSIVHLGMMTSDPKNAQRIVEALLLNNTVKVLRLSPLHRDLRMKIAFLISLVNKERTSRGCQTKLCVKFNVI